jgi:N-acetylglucosaminyldiphosphoundecaprenol N-acetyl-beta-D-mannosaminyltransferase
MVIPPRANVLGVGVHTVNMNEAVEFLEEAARQGRKGYVCVTGVHGVTECQQDETLRTTLNESLLNVPDGMPMVWVGKAQGFKTMGRVYGPELMERLCARSVKNGFTHFFFGGNTGVAEELREALTGRFPGLRVVGTYTPPFRPLDEEEIAVLSRMVAESRPDFFWVGLSTPKQERFMRAHIHVLDTTIMLGVGAAFDLHTGRMKDAPRWMKNSGLQWLHRLCQEPRRLARRYLINNPLFIVRIMAQFLGLRKYSL